MRQGKRLHAGRILPVVLLALCTLLLPRMMLWADTVEEYTAKAALTFNFARYTDWPASAVATSPEVLRVCVKGGDTVITAFKGVGGRRIGKRHIRVNALRRGDDPGNCDVIFVDSRDRRSISLLLARVRDLPVLTIGEIPGFADYGGIINIFRSGDKFRFEVSLKAAKRTNLVISSRLLRLAKVID